MAVANTLAYYVTAAISAVKSFIVQPPGFVLTTKGVVVTSRIQASIEVALTPDRKFRRFRSPIYFVQVSTSPLEPML